eukprot:350660-Chlamydomonas_euryale.AAC.2
MHALNLGAAMRRREVTRWMFSTGRPDDSPVLLKVICYAWESSAAPSEWKPAVIALLYKRCSGVVPGDQPPFCC